MVGAALRFIRCACCVIALVAGSVAFVAIQNPPPGFIAEAGQPLRTVVLGGSRLVTFRAQDVRAQAAEWIDADAAEVIWDDGPGVVRLRLTGHVRARLVDDRGRELGRSAIVQATAWVRARFDFVRPDAGTLVRVQIHAESDDSDIGAAGISLSNR